jgi:hypothetical protein
VPAILPRRSRDSHVLHDLLGPRWAGLLVIVVVAVVGALAVDVGMASDTAYQLIWGSEVAAADVPEFRDYGATPHPLAIAVGALASLAGRELGFDLMLAAAYLGLGTLVWAAFRLGQVTFGAAAGAVAAVAILVFPAYLGAALRAYVDVPYLALVLLAAVLEARSPRRGAPVLVLLALAGLLRPEAWLLSGLYWLWMMPVASRRARIGLTALAAAGPVLWALTDLVAASDPLWSLTSTREGAQELGRTTGAAHVPRTLTRYLYETIGPLVLVGGAIGALLALRARDRRAAVPLALLAVGLFGYVLVGVAGLSQIPRYVLLPGLALTLMFGYATTCAPAAVLRSRRRLALAGGIAALACALLIAPIRPGGQRGQLEALSARADAIRGIRTLATAAPGSELLRRCRPVSTASGRAVAFLAYFLDRRPDAFVSLERGRADVARRGVVLMPGNRATVEWFVQDGRDARRVDVDVPAGLQVAARTSTWRLMRGRCA